MSIPARPTVTEGIVREAAAEIAEKLDIDLDAIVEEYIYGDDGYELAKNLEKWQSIDVSRDQMEELDYVDINTRRLVEAAEKIWFEENDIQPPLPIGTQIKEGEITGIYEYRPAYYEVKTPDQRDDNSRLLIKFEDATEAA